MLKSASPSSGNGGLACRISFYRPSAGQPPHAHAFPGVSVILTGQLREEVGRREASVPEGAICVKPEGVQHSNSYGPEGATILSVSVHDPLLWTNVAPAQSWSWSSPEPNGLVELLRHFRLQDDRDGVRDTLLELLALAARRTARTGVPPQWLRRVRERLDDDPTLGLAGLAREADVHPVYLSRAFISWFGTSPSVYRARRKASLAVAFALSGRFTRSAAAQEAGFADQSHMLRSVRRCTGYGLSELLALQTYATNEESRLAYVLHRG